MLALGCALLQVLVQPADPGMYKVHTPHFMVPCLVPLLQYTFKVRRVYADGPCPESASQLLDAEPLHLVLGVWVHQLLGVQIYSLHLCLVYVPTLSWCTHIPSMSIRHMQQYLFLTNHKLMYVPALFPLCLCNLHAG
jgi:hypothetical protein